MGNEFEYYLLEADNGNYPRLEVDDDFDDETNSSIFSYDDEAAADAVAHLKFGYAEKGFTMPDYLWCDCRHVFSKKVYDELKNIAIKDFKLVPTIIKGKKGEEYTNYWAVNIYREYAFLDAEKSEVDHIHTEGRMAGRWSGVDKMVLDEVAMAKVPLAERLVYISREWSAQVFYHKSVVDAIKSVNPTGIRFRQGPEWVE